MKGWNTQSVGSQHLAHIMGKSCAMELMLMGCIWSVPRQVWAARSELVNIGTITNVAHAVGKSRVMKLVLTGRMWSAPCQVWAARTEGQQCGCRHRQEQRASSVGADTGNSRPAVQAWTQAGPCGRATWIVGPIISSSHQM